MHQNLVERADLPQPQKLDALFELAQDYLKAGLLDRAEELFAKLMGSLHEEAALKYLLEIYEQEKDWQKAVDTAQKLEGVTGQSHQKEIANFFCEMASREIMDSRPEAARPFLERALSHHRLCARANVLLGDLELALNRFEAAIDAWKRIETQNPDYLALVAERLIGAYKQLDKPNEGLNLLRGLLGKYPSLDVLNVVFSCILDQQGAEPAYQLVRDEMRRSPTLLGLDKLLEAQLLDAPVQRRQDLELVKNLVHQHTRTLSMYKCDNCGFRARQYYWHCPACGEWETYSPRRAEEKALPA
jgi:lipopolysaccharide biosynthesis regulator YciM